MTCRGAWQDKDGKINDAYSVTEWQDKVNRLIIRAEAAENGERKLEEALTIAWEALENYYDADFEEGKFYPNKAMDATNEIEALTGRKWYRREK
jgi:hypothetical protein